MIGISGQRSALGAGVRSRLGALGAIVTPSIPNVCCQYGSLDKLYSVELVGWTGLWSFINGTRVLNGSQPTTTPIAGGPVPGGGYNYKALVGFSIAPDGRRAITVSLVRSDDQVKYASVAYVVGASPSTFPPWSYDLYPIYDTRIPHASDLLPAGTGIGTVKVAKYGTCVNALTLDHYIDSWPNTLNITMSGLQDDLNDAHCPPGQICRVYWSQANISWTLTRSARFTWTFGVKVAGTDYASFSVQPGCTPPFNVSFEIWTKVSYAICVTTGTNQAVSFASADTQWAPLPKLPSFAFAPVVFGQIWYEGCRYPNHYPIQVRVS